MSRPTSRRALRAAAAAVAAVCLTVLAACGSSGSAPGTTASSSPSASPGALTVFAAASLRATFTEIGEIFRQQKPGSTVTFNFAGSSDLVTQITAGAPADVFASADENNMNKAVTAGVVDGTPANFASNILTIVTQPGNPKGITGFADMAKTDLQVVICAPQVPCGSATKQVEANTGATLMPVSEESSVTDVLNKVQTGQADAGLVYVTDAKNAGDKVTEVPFAEAAAVVNVYPIAALTAATEPELAAEFVELVTGPDGQQVLEEAGFQSAP